ncbi:hypothetical protein ACMWCG_28810, partial [Klebsiella pneumoniae]
FKTETRIVIKINNLGIENKSSAPNKWNNQRNGPAKNSNSKNKSNEKFINLDSNDCNVILNSHLGYFL